MSETLLARDQPLDRAFAILEAVVAADRSLSITDIAAALDLPAPSVHRLVAQLLDRELLKRELHSKRVLAGARLVEFGAAVLSSAVRADQPHTILLGLANRLGENCQIGIVAEGEVLYVDTARAERGIGLQFQPGRRAPLHCTSIGKLYLASLSKREFELWLANAPLTQITPATIADAEALSAQWVLTRERGWAESHEEYVEGVVGCAVPIIKQNRFVAGLGIAAPAVRLTRARQEEILPHLQKAARNISEVFG